MNKYKDLSGKVVLITGAFGHIGKVLASGFAENGCSLVLLDKDSVFDEKFYQKLKNVSTSIQFHPIDLESKENRKSVIRRIISENRCIDVLINNAAFVGTSDLEGWTVPFEQQSIETWSRALEVNLTAPFELIQGLIAPLRKSEGASIINVASIYGVIAPDLSIYEGTKMGNPAAYAASKAGLIHLTRWLATALAPQIRVNSVSPGGIFRGQEPLFLEKYIKKTPLGRMATEEDISNFIAYLASDSSSYLTGQNQILDGGFTIW